MASIELRNINKSITEEGIFKTLFSGPKRKAVYKTLSNRKKNIFSINDLNLSVPDGKVMVILGPSGCGKTTLLRLIAGLISPDSGEIFYNGVKLEEIPKEERCIGMVFQNYALYPHFTAKDNIISYYFFRKKTPALTKIAEEKLQKTSKLMDISVEYLFDRKPKNMSGGERQRIAMGRCITRNPILFLLDEPFSNLDQILRQKYRSHLKTLLRDFSITTVFVTHDQQESLILADIIAVMRDGQIEQCGTYETLYSLPASLFVAEFLNPILDVPAINLVPGEVLASEYQDKNAGIRAQDIELSVKQKQGWIDSCILSIRHTPFKNDIIAEIGMRNHHLIACIPIEKSQEITTGPVWIDFRRIHLFDKDSGLRLDTVDKPIKLNAL